jgi:hypothetical protein
LVSRTNPSEHEGILIDIGTGSSFSHIPLLFKCSPDGQPGVGASGYALLTHPPFPSEIKPDWQVYFPSDTIAGTLTSETQSPLESE